MLLLLVTPLLDAPKEGVPVQPLGPSELVQDREVSRTVGIVGVLLATEVLQCSMVSSNIIPYYYVIFRKSATCPKFPSPIM